MRRRLFTLVSALSLTLFVATVVLWVRGLWVVDSVWVGTAPFPTTNGCQAIVHWKVRFGYGDIYVERALHESRNSSYLASVSQSGTASESSDTGKMINRWSPRELGHGKEEWKDSLRSYQLSYVTFPLWWPMLLFGLGLIPTIRRWHLMAKRVRLERRIRIAALEVVCVSCRYDLTANASGTCPECGTPIKTPK